MSSRNSRPPPVAVAGFFLRAVADLDTRLGTVVDLQTIASVARYSDAVDPLREAGRCTHRRAPAEPAAEAGGGWAVAAPRVAIVGAGMLRTSQLP